MKHMWPNHLEQIWSQLKDLTVTFGFPAGSRPFIAGEVINGGVFGNEYYHLGTITDFDYGYELARHFTGGNVNLNNLHDFGHNQAKWGMHPSNLALTFVDNHV